MKSQFDAFRQGMEKGGTYGNGSHPAQQRAPSTATVHRVGGTTAGDKAMAAAFSSRTPTRGPVKT